jgi:hypothetical protein
MNRLRRRIPWIIVPLLLIVPLILVACGGGGLSDEDAARIDAAAEAAEKAAAAASVPQVDTAAIVSQAVTQALEQVPEPPEGISIEDVSSAISMAMEEIPEGVTAEDVEKASRDAAMQVAEGTLTLEQVEGAIAMALDKAAEEAAMMAMKEAEEAAMMAMKEQEERLQQIYASFFDGQTIRLLVGFSAGGGYDTYGRAIARHIGKHIPGNPDIVVENMTGAGSLVAANHLYNQAEPDGLTVGLWNSNHILVQVLVDDPAARGVLFDGAKYGWLGAPSDGNPVCAIMGVAGVTDASEILAPGTTFKHGSTASTGGPLADIPHTTNAFLGTNHEVVSGYRGTATVRLALQGGEVDSACWGWESMGVTARSMLDAEGDEQFIPYVMTFPSDDPEIADLPLIGDFFEDPEQQALWDLWRVGYQFQRPWTTPPGTAPELIDVMQEAFTATMADPDFIADAEAAGLYLNPQTGDDIEGWVAQMLSITPEQKAALEFLVSLDQE